MRRKILVADLLCGAGGSSTGAQRALEALGLEMELVCVNHWGVAIETHRRNHPEARHYVQDIATVRPHILVPEGYLDLLMASPTCTHHSVARGGKPTSDQQRSDPWHIITWLTELRVKRIIIENVWEFCFPAETTVLTKRGVVPPAPVPVGLQPRAVAVRHVVSFVINEPGLDLGCDDVPETVNSRCHLRLGHGATRAQLPFADGAGQGLDVVGAHGWLVLSGGDDGRR